MGFSKATAGTRPIISGFGPFYYIYCFVYYDDDDDDDKSDD